MKGRWPWIIGGNLLALLVLTFAYPHLMVSPGPLIPQHAALTTDCFACHTPWRGATAERCTSCHVLQDIGIRTTRGVLIKVSPEKGAAPLKTSFHQQLIEPDCLACHDEHAGVRLTQGLQRPFSHVLLRVAVRDRCEVCHAAPANDFHRNVRASCVQCHKTKAWKPASFDHAMLSAAERDRCESCHQPPKDVLHRPIKGDCGGCHTTRAWKPATFDHDRLFLLDGDHKVECAVCHVGGDLRRYTCYGCHAHTPANVRAAHREEGIADLNNCVRCHRSARGEGEGD